jgi:cysteine desulfurase
MLPHLRGEATWGNPSSLHSRGAAAREAVEDAREFVARLVGAASPKEIVFTSGGTESDNMAIFGLAAAAPEKRHVVVSPVEHAAVREAVARLAASGYEVTQLEVDADGLVSPDRLKQALRPETALVAVMWANNEVGAVQPAEELAEICRDGGVPFHADAVQVAGRLPIDVSKTPVSTLAVSAHKLYGPQGVGALYVRGGTGIEPVLVGGRQEGGLRSGTENVAGIVGFGAAARLADLEFGERARHEEGLREALISHVLQIPGVGLNGHRERRLSNNVHLSVEGVESESLMLYLDVLGYAVGTGSACASRRTGAGHKASPVLIAMGRAEREALSALRITVGKDTTREQINGFYEAFETAVARLREVSPLYARS